MHVQHCNACHCFISTAALSTVLVPGGWLLPCYTVTKRLFPLGVLMVGGYTGVGSVLMVGGYTGLGENHGFKHIGLLTTTT